MNNKLDLPGAMPRHLMFSKQVDQDSINELIKSIIEINNNDKYLVRLYNINGVKYTPKPIKIYIDSYGGYVYQILGLINIIEQSKTPIHTIVTGCAMSCGYLLLISGHKRFAYKHSTILYHAVSNTQWGQIQQLKERYLETKRLQKIVENLTLKRTKITNQKLQDIKEKKIDWYISSKQAEKLKIVDKIIK